MFYENNKHSVFLLKYVLIFPLNEGIFPTEEATKKLRIIFNNIATGYNITLHHWINKESYIEISFRAHPKTELSKFINAYKAASSRAMRKDFRIIERGESGFWKKSFLLFTEGERNDGEIETYIKKQFKDKNEKIGRRIAMERSRINYDEIAEQENKKIAEECIYGDDKAAYGESIGETVRKELKKMYPAGLPDGLVVNRNRPIGDTSRETWLSYLEEKGYTEETFKTLDDLKRYQLHCSYCNRYNIPHIED